MGTDQHEELVFGRLKVRVHDDQAALAAAAAAFASEKIREAVAGSGIANVMFATGNSQLAFVDALVELSGEIPWHQVVVFHMDEYVGIASDHPAGFQRWIRERIINRVRPRAAYYIEGAADPEKQCARYTELLESNRIDLCCLGIGENGHLAFNDPGVADFDDPRDVKVVELDAACRLQQVHEGHFPDVGSVPPKAVTVTIPALLRATSVLGVVPESRKATAVRAALEGPLDTSCPASVLRNRANAVLYLDRDSASLLTRRQAVESRRRTPAP